MVKSWIFEFFRAPAAAGATIAQPRTDVTSAESAAHFASYWDMWTRAEDYGFEGIFFSEHHFGPGYSPSPNLLIAALAPVTKTLRLGVMGVVLPYYQPWRVIEEIGMLDQLTNGRLEVGTASGIPPEMAQVGLGVAEANERNAEAQGLLDWALTHPGEAITHAGKYWNFNELRLVPGPVQHIPNRWTTVVSEASARRAAHRGTKICTGFSSVEQVQKVFNGYREEAEKAGRAVTADSFGLRRVVVVDKDRAKAQAIGDDVAEKARKIFENHDDKVNHGPVPDAPQKSHGGIQLSADEYISGTPSEVAEQIIAQCDAIGADHFMSMLDNHGTLEANRAAYELFANEVNPLLRKAVRSSRSEAAALPA